MNMTVFKHKHINISDKNADFASDEDHVFFLFKFQVCTGTSVHEWKCNFYSSFVANVEKKGRKMYVVRLVIGHLVYPIKTAIYDNLLIDTSLPALICDCNRYDRDGSLSSR